MIDITYYKMDEFYKSQPWYNPKFVFIHIREIIYFQSIMIQSGSVFKLKKR